MCAALWKYGTVHECEASKIKLSKGIYVDRKASIATLGQSGVDFVCRSKFSHSQAPFLNLTCCWRKIQFALSIFSYLFCVSLQDSQASNKCFEQEGREIGKICGRHGRQCCCQESKLNLPERCVQKLML